MLETRRWLKRKQSFGSQDSSQNVLLYAHDYSYNDNNNNNNNNNEVKQNVTLVTQPERIVFSPALERRRAPANRFKLFLKTAGKTEKLLKGFSGCNQLCQRDGLSCYVNLD